MDGVQDVPTTLVFINSCRSNLDLVTLHVCPTSWVALRLEVLEGSIADWRAQRRRAGRRTPRRASPAQGRRARQPQRDRRASAGSCAATPPPSATSVRPLDQLSWRASARVLRPSSRQGRRTPARRSRADRRALPHRRGAPTPRACAFVAAAISEITEVVDFARWLGYLGVLVVALVVANTVFIMRSPASARWACLRPSACSAC